MKSTVRKSMGYSSFRMFTSLIVSSTGNFCMYSVPGSARASAACWAGVFAAMQLSTPAQKELPPQLPAASSAWQAASQAATCAGQRRYLRSALVLSACTSSRPAEREFFSSGSPLISITSAISSCLRVSELAPTSTPIYIPCASTTSSLFTERDASPMYTQPLCWFMVSVVSKRRQVLSLQE
jgi:hypothetical protein